MMKEAHSKQFKNTSVSQINTLIKCIQHKVNLNTFDWVPNPFEQHYIHSFRMPYQLTEKYPQEMGGIRLVPKKWKDAETKIHKDAH